MLKQIVKKAWGALSKPAWVLMYHRIATPETDPWNLAVSPKKFEQQLQWLKQHRRLLHLDELANYWNEGRLPRNSVALSFDDGYLDNFTTALPLLERHGVPATFFICTRPLEQQLPFWWDELTTLLLGAEALQLPKLEGVVEAKSLAAQSETEKAQNNSWRFPQPAPNERTAVYLKIWEALRSCSEDVRGSWLAQLRAANHHITDKPTGTMSKADLETLKHHPLVRIGAHTVHHPALGFLPATEQQEEMVRSRLQLEDWLQQPVPLFAFPYGHYNNESFALAGACGFQASFTTAEMPVNKAKNPQGIGRKMVTNETRLPYDLF